MNYEDKETRSPGAPCCSTWGVDLYLPDFLLQLRYIRQDEEDHQQGDSRQDPAPEVRMHSSCRSRLAMHNDAKQHTVPAAPQLLQVNPSSLQAQQGRQGLWLFLLLWWVYVGMVADHCHLPSEYMLLFSQTEGEQRSMQSADIHWVTQRDPPPFWLKLVWQWRRGPHLGMVFSKRLGRGVWW